MAKFFIIAVWLLGLVFLGLAAQHPRDRSAAQDRRVLSQVARAVVERRQDASISSELPSTVMVDPSAWRNLSTAVATPSAFSSDRGHNQSPVASFSTTSIPISPFHYANFSTTITPSNCYGTQQLGLAYVTTTITRVETITAASFPGNRTLPTLIAPTPFCSSLNTGSVHHVSGTAFVPTIIPFLSQTLRATVKTTVLVAPEMVPAIHFADQPTLTSVGVNDPMPLQTPALPSPEQGFNPNPNSVPSSPEIDSNPDSINQPPFPEHTSDPKVNSEPPQKPGAGESLPLHGTDPEQDQGHSKIQTPQPGILNFGNSPQVVLNGITIAAHLTDAVIGSHTFSVDKSTTAVQIVDGQTFLTLSSGHGIVGPAGLTVTAAPAMITPPTRVVRVANQAFTAVPLHSLEIEVDGSTVHVPDSGSTILTISGSPFTLDKSQIIAQGSSIALPTTDVRAVLNQNLPSLTIKSVDDITFDLGNDRVVIEGKTLDIGSGAPTSTLVIHGETVIVGPKGVGFPTTTIGPLQTATTVITVDGIAIAVASKDVVIDGSTYYYSNPTAIVDGSQKISIGAFGVEIASTTISPPSATTITTPFTTTASPTAAFQYASHSAFPSSTSGASPLPDFGWLASTGILFVSVWFSHV